MSPRVLIALDMVRTSSHPELDSLHAELLATTNLHPHASVMLSIDNVPQHMYARAHAFLTGYFGKHLLLSLSGHMALKALPFWQEVFKRYDVCADYILIVRHPLQSGIQDVQQWLIMWASHWTYLIENTCDCKRIIVSQELLQHQLSEQLGRVEGCLQLSDAEANALKACFTDCAGGIVRQSADTSVLKTVPYCMDVYDGFLKVAKGVLQLDSVEFAARWNAVMQEHARTVPMYTFMDALLVEQSELDFKLHNIRHSWLWRLLWPLRLLDDWLRHKRRQLKLKNRKVATHD